MKERKNKKAAKRDEQLVVFPCTEPCYTVAIVGGGASGIAAACALADRAQRSGDRVRVLLLERGRRLGSSILRSGNGRCNFSHANIQPSHYNDPVFVEEVLRTLEEVAFEEKGASSSQVECERVLASYAPAARANAVLRWFFELGLVWEEAPHSGGLLYPFSNKATSVLEVLQVELDRLGVACSCGIEVTDISREGDGFAVCMRDAHDHARSTALSVDALVVATGGDGETGLLRSSSLCEDAAFAPARFVLGPLRTETCFLEGLDGMRAHVRLSCADRSFSEEGQVLFRTYGISGIVVFNASRFVEAGDVLTLDLVPELSFASLKEILLARVHAYAIRTGSTPTYEMLLRGFFLPKLARALISYSVARSPESGVTLETPVDNAGVEHLVACIKRFELVVIGQGDEGQCQVCRGGLRTSEVCVQTMEVERMPGLYVTGEALDIDGPCGGYNLHWAWASGLLAGSSIACKLHDLADDHSRERA